MQKINKIRKCLKNTHLCTFHGWLILYLRPPQPIPFLHLFACRQTDQGNHAFQIILKHVEKLRKTLPWKPQKAYVFYFVGCDSKCHVKCFILAWQLLLRDSAQPHHGWSPYGPASRRNHCFDPPCHHYSKISF